MLSHAEVTTRRAADTAAVLQCPHTQHQQTHESWTVLGMMFIIAYNFE